MGMRTAMRKRLKHEITLHYVAPARPCIPRSTFYLVCSISLDSLPLVCDCWRRVSGEKPSTAWREWASAASLLRVE
jgi:hypothetical protein